MKLINQMNAYLQLLLLWLPLLSSISRNFLYFYRFVLHSSLNVPFTLPVY